MKTIAIVIFDNFTDIDLFFMWDLFGRDKETWKVKIIGSKPEHSSYSGLKIATHGNLSEANHADIVLFSSSRTVRELIKDQSFLASFHLNQETQIIGSICSGALIMAALGLLKGRKGTTHPTSKELLKEMGVDVVDQPLVCYGNIATAGGCLSAQYLVGWVMNKVHNKEKTYQILQGIFPVGQKDLYKELLNSTIEDAQQSTIASTLSSEVASAKLRDISSIKDDATKTDISNKNIEDEKYNGKSLTPESYRPYGP